MYNSASENKNVIYNYLFCSYNWKVTTDHFSYFSYINVHIYLKKNCVPHCSKSLSLMDLKVR